MVFWMRQLYTSEPDSEALRASPKPALSRLTNAVQMKMRMKIRPHSPDETFGVSAASSPTTHSNSFTIRLRGRER